MGWFSEMPQSPRKRGDIESEAKDSSVAKAPESVKKSMSPTFLRSLGVPLSLEFYPELGIRFQKFTASQVEGVLEKIGKDV